MNEPRQWTKPDTSFDVEVVYILKINVFSFYKILEWRIYVGVVIRYLHLREIFSLQVIVVNCMTGIVLIERWLEAAVLVQRLE